jgi:hypothetical protein
MRRSTAGGEAEHACAEARGDDNSIMNTNEFPRRITYLLGAGASYGALPINIETQEFLRRFATYLWNNPVKDGRAREARFDIFTDLLRLIEEFPAYGSYDKMAKHLLCEGPDFKAMREQHQHVEAFFGHELPFPWNGHIDRTTTLARLKVLLATFYFFEQFRDKSKDDYSLSIAPGQSKVDIRPLRQLEVVDARIESLLRSCLGTGKGSIPYGVQFLTWNYDLQLEMAYARIKGLQDVYRVLASDHLNVHPGRQRDRFQREPAVVHLNGIAGLLYNLDNATTRLMAYGDIPNTLSIEELLGRNGEVTYHLHPADFPWSHHETFSFAWEDHWPSRIAQKYLFDMGLSTNVLVLFGYSRPELNARLDFRFLGQFFFTYPGLDKKIILCGRDADGDELRRSWGVPSTVEIIVDNDIARIPTPEEIRSRYGPNPEYSIPR